jgi:hypothetical protein
MRHLLALALLCTAVMAGAEPAGAGSECRCRLYEQRLAIGTITCIKGKLAQCLMFQNTPSWKYIADSCPIAETPAPFHPHAASPPTRIARR